MKTLPIIALVAAVIFSSCTPETHNVHIRETPTYVAPAKPNVAPAKPKVKAESPYDIRPVERY
jgi:hypothetical protein